MEKYKKQLKGSQLSGTSENRNRADNDFYATPPKSTKAILDLVELHGDILEPACGQGHISKEIIKKYNDVNITSTDLIYRGYGIGGIDFLSYDFKKKFDIVITNPPFKLAKEFIYKSLEISSDKVIIFAKLVLLEGKSRRKLFESTPLKYVYVFTERQSPLNNGSEVDENGKKWASTMCFAWFVWEKGYEGEPIIRWI